MRRLLITFAALASTAWIGPALAENRIALVIGNSNYATVTALPNPANDAKAMTTFLSSAGFQILQAPDLSQNDMRRTISNFANIVAEKGPDTVALVFYAGHGLQVDGENYLVPVDASIQREADVPLQAMRLADVMNALAAVPSKTRIVILDACRNNPFSEINKTTGRGLAIVDAPTGSLVSYSTAPGTEAQDGDGANSPFTSALLKFGQKPGIPIEQMLKQVRLAVNESTNRHQTPWESSSLTSDFTFFPTESGQPKMASAGQPTSPASVRAETRSVDSWQKELKSHTPREAYEIVVREDKVEAYQAYLALYPSQSMAPFVRTIVDRRRLMIAWYEAVTVNTVVSYQTFLAAYADSDFALTAHRLVDRARTRSVANGMAAFASAAATCPCSQPTAPTPRPKRADVSPLGNPGPSGPAIAAPVPVPVPVYTDPVPPVRIVTTPPHIHLPPVRGHDKPPRTGGDKPDKPQTGGHDKPTHDKPTYGKPTYGKDKLGSVRTLDPRPVRTGNSVGRPLGHAKPSWEKPIRSGTTGIAPRGTTMNGGMTIHRGGSFNRGMSMGLRPGFRPSFGGGRRFF